MCPCLASMREITIHTQERATKARQTEVTMERPTPEAVPKVGPGLD